jgi:protein phosphatase
MKVSAFAFTDIGKSRANNEDSYRLGPHVSHAGKYEESVAEFLFPPSLPTEDGSEPPAPVLPVLTFVCDGVGGRAAGEVASAYVVDHLANVPDAAPESLVERLTEVNLGLYNLMHESSDCIGMGCTIAGIVLSPQGLLAFALGDSTVFEFTGRFFRPLTDVHTSTGDYDGKLYRALGCHPQPMAPMPSLRPIPRGPALFLIATDGVIRNLDERRLAPLLNAASNPAEMGKILHDMVLETEARDNFTAILLEVHD